MNAVNYFRRDTAHLLMPFIMLPPFSLVSKTLRTLLRYSLSPVLSFSFIESDQFRVYPDMYNLLLQLILQWLFHRAMKFHQILLFPLFRINAAYLSMPNSMPISSMKIRIVWTSYCKPSSFLAYNLKSSMKRR